jgi:hypothetical protein
MNCKEFSEYIVSNWPLEGSLPEGPLSDHAKQCRKCEGLLSLLEASPDLGKEKLTPEEAAQLWGSMSETTAGAVPEERKSAAWMPKLLPVAALIAAALAVGAFIHFYNLPTPSETEHPGEPMKKVEMYIHKTGTPETEASYLYLEVHEKRKEKP